MLIKECIIHRQYSTNECLFVRELFPIFTTSCAAMHLADILKVFSHCPEWKMWKFFNNNGTTNSTHFLFRYMRSGIFIAHGFHIYSSVGYSFIFPWVLSEPSVR